MGRNRRRGWVAGLVRAVVSLAAACVLCVSCSHATPRPPAPLEDYDGVSQFEELSSSSSSGGDDHMVQQPPPPSPPPPPASHRDSNSDPRLFCSATAKNVDHFLLVVSTIDGAVSALDMRTSGDLLWSVKADQRPLLSSSITNIQVTRDGVSTRLIPSLDGGLYEFDGEDIKALPMTADSLLSSSLRITDNSVMVGGKEVGSYGVDVLTGELSYQCTAAGCEDTTEAANNSGDMLLITRSMQTVRAVEVNSGSEKWNFSVGQHELLFVRSQKEHPGIEHDDDYDDLWNAAADEDVRIDSCIPIDDEEVAMEEAHLKQLIKVVVSDGLVVGLNPEDPTQMAWSRKFSSPVAKAWILHRGRLESISLFDSKVVPSLSSSQQSFQHQRNSRGDPLLYVGTHKRQLYVQKEEADYSCEKELPWVLEQEVEERLHVPRVTWRPYITKSHTPLFLGNEQPQVPLLEKAKFAQHVKGEQQAGNSLTVWHENYPFDMGYYLYPSRLTGAPLHLDLEPAMEEGIMDVLPSLWMWWKEVVVISLLVSLAVHLLLTYVIYRPVRVVVQVDSGSLDKKDSSGSLVSNDSSPTLLDERPPAAQEFKSRFADEFDCMEQLGKGGYGIVFRAKNKVDEQEYAVKRIALPNRDGAVKKKMLREVRTLAMLDHVGIVRYFHSWIEDPPPGWQEELDRAFRDVLGTSDGLSPTTDVTLASTMDSRSVSPRPPSPAPPKRPSAAGRQPSVLDSIIPFRPEIWDQEADFPSFRGCSDSRTGSAEFSRHSNVEGSTDESGSFSLGAGEELREVVGGEGGEEEGRDSLSIVFQHSSEAGSDLGEGGGRGDEASRSGDPALPFGRYASGSMGSRPSSSPGPPKDAGSNEESSSIVFEDSQGRESNILSESSSIVFGDSRRKGDKDCSQSSSIVFEDSRRKGDKDCSQSSSIVFEDSRGKGSSGPHHQQQCRSAVLSDSSYGGSVDGNETEYNNAKKDDHAIDITLSSHRGGGEEQPCAAGEREDRERDQRAAKPAEKKPKLYLYLQMQLCRLETLKDWLIANTLNRERTVILDIFEQIVSAVDYVHAKGLIHRDLKPSNIFFALDNTVKVGDFGLVTAPENQGEGSELPPSSKASAKHTAEVGTQLYMSPEQVQKKAYDQKVDIFSLGLIFLELLMPFSTGMERVTTLQNARKGVFPERFMRELPVESALVRQLMSSRPERRPTTLEILEHSLLRDLIRPPRRHGGSRYRTISGSSNHSDPAALFAEQ